MGVVCDGTSGGRPLRGGLRFCNPLVGEALEPPEETSVLGLLGRAMRDVQEAVPYPVGAGQDPPLRGTVRICYPLVGEALEPPE